jgi:hypothetical protein
MKLRNAIFCLGILAGVGVAHAEHIEVIDLTHKDRASGGAGLWKASIIALAGANALDAYSTLRMPPGFVETNPLGQRGVVIGKALALPLAVWGQRRYIRSHPRAEKWLGMVNLSLAAEFGGMGLHNEMIYRRGK